VLDDREGVLEDVDEQERQHAYGEHRERYARPLREQLQATEGEAHEDREACECSQYDRFSKRHARLQMEP
jgi:hypothetical protein